MHIGVLEVLEFLQCTKLEQREEMKINFINLFGLRGEGNNFLRFYKM